MSLSIREHVTWLFAWTRRYRKQNWLAFALITAGGMFGLLDALILRWLIDEVLPGRRLDLLAVAVLGILTTFSGGLLLPGMGELVASAATNRVRLRIRLSTLRRVQSFSADYHDHTPVSETLFRIQQDVDQVADLCGPLLVGLVRALTVSGITLAIMSALNLRLTLIVLPLVPAYLLLRRHYETHLRRWSADARNEMERANSFLTEHVSWLVQVQLLRQQIAGALKFVQLERAVATLQLRRQRVELAFGIASFSIIIVAGAALLGYGGLAVMNGALSTGTLIAFYSYVLRLFDPMSSIVGLDKSVQAAAASLGRLLQLHRTTPSVREAPDAMVLPVAGELLVRCRDVHFGYGPSRPVLHGVSFHVRAGERVALLGKSGSGKSTIGKLLARLYDVDAGAIEVRGHDLRRVRLDSLRRVVGLVPQDPVLFDTTVAENLRLGHPHAAVEDLKRAIQAVQLERVVDALPLRWDEPLGPRSSLSGGERQRLARARALLGWPDVLILDEVTSGLDFDTEQRLLQELARWSPDMAILFISHRRSVAAWADRRLWLRDGTVVECTMDDLAPELDEEIGTATLHERGNLPAVPLPS